MTEDLENIEDVTLWTKARDGDRQALDELLRRHEKRVFRFGLRMCGDEDAAREVLQRTLLTAFERVGDFRGESRISTWLYSIARSYCSRFHRRTRSAPTHDVDLDADEAPVLIAQDDRPEAQAQRAEMAELVSAAIQTLPPAYREIVVLRDVEGLSGEEASEVLGLELPAMKSRLHRARSMLKVALAALLRDERTPAGARACPKLRDKLASLAGHAVDRTACEEIEKHLAECPTCEEGLGDLKEAAGLCRRLPGGEVPAPVQRAVRAALRDALEHDESSLGL